MMMTKITGTMHRKARKMNIALYATLVPGRMALNRSMPLPVPRRRALFSTFADMLFSSFPQNRALSLSSLRTMPLATSMVMHPSTDCRKPAAEM